MQKRKLEDLNLIDDFLFFAMLNDEVVGEEFGRYLLEIIFNREFGKLKVVPQKVYYGTDVEKRGVRLDVYLEEEINSTALLENSAIYDVEVESEGKVLYKDTLPKRVRFYHSKIDVGCLGSGQDFRKLKKVIVVMILPFDLFGYDHMIYTIKNTCLEVPELPYDDGAKTLFLYTKGKYGNPSESLKELLQYIEETKQENVKNEKLRAIHNMVKVVKRDAEVSREYMKIFEKERMLRELGYEEGYSQGRAQGHELGLIKGRAEGIIRLMLKLGKDEKEIIEELMEELGITAKEAELYCRK